MNKLAMQNSPGQGFISRLCIVAAHCVARRFW